MRLLSAKPIGKFLKLCDFFVVLLIFVQYNSNSINCSRSQDSNLSNGNYVAEILRRSKRQNGIGSRCEIPNYGLHVKYTILGETTATYQPGDYAQPYYTLEVSCDQGYNLKPFLDKRTVCISGQWNPSLTINCIRTCPSLKSTMSTNVKCKYHNIPLANCHNPVEETTAYLSCNPLHEQDSLVTNRIRLCRSGRWNPSISECYPICGTKRPKGRPTIVNGQNATVGDYPWQAGIYNARKDLICGGSILDRHIILTAAHCLTDHNGNVNPTADYLIAAGKYYRKYDDVKDEYSQYSKVQSIYVPDRYTGLINNFALDIAIILLTDPFTITIGVQPVCIELNEESPFLHLSSDSNGIVTGWGYTVEGRQLSEALKELVIPFIPFRKCLNEVPNHFKKFITSDKICGGYLNSETSVCQGDSGGALVFQNTLTERYYVKGIVSISPETSEFTCDSNQYSLYTSVKDHVEFITNILAYNPIQQSIEFTNEDIDTCSSDQFVSEMLHQTSSTLPQIIPKVAELTVYVSSTFELRCLSKNSVTWNFPNNLERFFVNENLTKHSTITIKSSTCNSVHESLLTINNVSYLDVGFYYCHERSRTNTKMNQTSSIYIYVHDDQNLLFMPEYSKQTITELSNIILPCLPTAPDVHVKLMLNSDVEIQLNSENNTYDSKIGFPFSLNDDATIFHQPFVNYTCRFSRGPYTQLAVVDVHVELYATCSIPKDRGLCRNYEIKYFYDVDYGGCTRFWYGGCGGNSNKFQSLDECESVCMEPINIKRRCSLPNVTGPCEGVYTKWYYNSKKQSCAQFLYGGCKGNNNNFETMEECEKICKTI